MVLNGQTDILLVLGFHLLPFLPQIRQYQVIGHWLALIQTVQAMERLLKDQSILAPLASQAMICKETRSNSKIGSLSVIHRFLAQ